ncbi:MAG: hypothetical protein ACPLTR_09385 [Thermacetogeniaceae bacterium]
MAVLPDRGSTPLASTIKTLKSPENQGLAGFVNKRKGRVHLRKTPENTGFLRRRSNKGVTNGVTKRATKTPGTG